MPKPCVVLFLVALLPASFVFDRIVVEWVRNGGLDVIPGDVHSAIEVSEVFAHGLSVAFIICLICKIRRERWTAMFLAASSLGAGLVADVVKLFVHRVRPSAIESVANFGETFRCGFLHLDVTCALTGSFPSAHTATAFGFAAGLAKLYPRGAAFFWIAAVLAGVQRIDVLAHYPSDVLAGAAIGIAVSRSCKRWLPPNP